jgi:hypothetical protein
VVTGLGRRAAMDERVRISQEDIRNRFEYKTSIEWMDTGTGTVGGRWESWGQLRGVVEVVRGRLRLR